MAKNDQLEKLRGRNRFSFKKVLFDTLQGRLYLSRDKTGENGWVVIKEAWRGLVEQGKTRKGYNVSENFKMEVEIQKYLSQLPGQDAFVRYIDYWEDEKCLYLAMEFCERGGLLEYVQFNHGQGGLNKFVRQVATQPQKCQANVNSWSLCVQSIFHQMVNAVALMHLHKIAHLDLSLENVMIAFIKEGFVKIKIIDFGVAKSFKENERFDQRVGKFTYMAPEVYSKDKYLPGKADIWCLGVMLFSMLVGAPLYKLPDLSDLEFKFVITGHLQDLLVQWRRLPLVPVDALDVMEKIFKPETERISMEELCRHKYVQLSCNVKSNIQKEPKKEQSS